MRVIKSVEDLQKMHSELRETRASQGSPAPIQIVIGMGTAGIAAGASDTLAEIETIITEKQMTGIRLVQAGDLGLDSLAPILQVQIGLQAPVLYARVTPSVAALIIEQHVLGGQLVRDALLPV